MTRLRIHRDELIILGVFAVAILAPTIANLFWAAVELLAESF